MRTSPSPTLARFVVEPFFLTVNECYRDFASGSRIEGCAPVLAFRVARGAKRRRTRPRRRNVSVCAYPEGVDRSPWMLRAPPATFQFRLLLRLRIPSRPPSPYLGGPPGD